jgi:hypothetical protein
VTEAVHDKNYDSWHAYSPIQTAAGSSCQINQLGLRAFSKLFIADHIDMLEESPIQGGFTKGERTSSLLYI